jgi:hypothetical protein
MSSFGRLAKKKFTIVILNDSFVLKDFVSDVYISFARLWEVQSCQVKNSKFIFL